MRQLEQFWKSITKTVLSCYISNVRTFIRKSYATFLFNFIRFSCYSTFQINRGYAWSFPYLMYRVGFSIFMIIFFSFRESVLTPNMPLQCTDSTLVCPVKMEYGPENNIFFLKMMMKSGLEKNILKFLHAQAIFF